MGAMCSTSSSGNGCPYLLFFFGKKSVVCKLQQRKKYACCAFCRPDLHFPPIDTALLAGKGALQGHKGTPLQVRSDTPGSQTVWNGLEN